MLGTLALALGLVTASVAAAAADERPHALPRTETAIVNGVPTHGFPPVVLLGISGADGVGTCSGTLVGCHTILSAAHCFCSGVPGSLCFPNLTTVSAAFFQHIGVLGVESVAVHPQWTGNVVDGNDLALIRLDTTGIPIGSVALNGIGSVPAGIDGVVTGFGTTRGGLNESGIKRAGIATTSSCAGGLDDSLFCTRLAAPLGPAGEDSGICFGDSGGPMFFDTTGGNTVLGGVVSAVTNQCVAPSLMTFAEVFEGRSWILQAGGGDIGDTTCGSPWPNAGTPSSPFYTASGRLTASNGSESWSVNVPPGTGLISVALNAMGSRILESDPGNDFDLSVTRPNGTSACAVLDPSSFESCLIPDPPPGQWSATVDRFRGNGDYQLTFTVYPGGGGGGLGCTADTNNLCLANGRFRVRVSFRTTSGAAGTAQAVELTSDTGYFWFFDPNNVEIVLKVLNGCGLNNRFWVFSGGLTDVEALITVTDTVTGVQEQYFNSLGVPFQPIQDTNAFATCGAAATAPATTDFPASEAQRFSGLVEALSARDALLTPPNVVEELAASAVCGTTGTKLCVAQNRFEVEVDFLTAQSAGQAQTVKLTNDTGYFWFFHQNNVELVVKVLNGCAFNNRFWVYAGGLTDTQTTLRIRDTNTGATQTYFNSFGTPFQPIQDTAAFTCP